MASKSPKVSGPKYFVTAESRVHADNCCVVEWGWKRSAGGWIDPDGNRVVYLAKLDQLEGLEKPRVYRGFKWYACHIPNHLHDRVEAGLIEWAEPKTVPKEQRK